MIVTSYLVGGLGNQMFQISKVISELLEHNLNLVFLKKAFILMYRNQPTKYLTNIIRNIKFVDFLLSTYRVSELHWFYSVLKINYTIPIEYYEYFQSSKNFLNFKKEKQVDTYYTDSQKKFNCYGFYLNLVTQKKDLSNIQNKFVDYSIYFR